MDNPNKTVDISLARGGLAPYAHLKNFLKEGLASGRWKAGTLMPSESELVRQFQVSRMTAARALRFPNFFATFQTPQPSTAFRRFMIPMGLLSRASLPSSLSH